MKEKHENSLKSKIMKVAEKESRLIGILIGMLILALGGEARDFFR